MQKERCGRLEDACAIKTREIPIGAKISGLDSLLVELAIYEFNFPATTKQLQRYNTSLIKP